MAEMTTKIPISSVTKEMIMHVEVTGVRWFSFRLNIAKALIRLAAKIAGVGVRIVQGHDLDGFIKSQSPLVCWKLGDTSGTAAEDSSGNGRNGTYEK